MRREIAKLHLPSLPATNAKRLRKGALATKQSILSFFARRDGLLRFARNDVEEANPDLIAPQLCSQYRGQNGRKTACLAAF